MLILDSLQVDACAFYKIHLHEYIKSHERCAASTSCGRLIAGLQAMDFEAAGTQCTTREQDSLTSAVLPQFSESAFILRVFQAPVL